MKPSTELFNLIKSLSKSEKRFFKLSSSLQSGSKNYLKIFNAIDKQKEYDEEGIKEQFKKETFIKHFPSEKNHLYKLILKSLRAYHSENAVSSILKQEIKNIEILFSKALYKECNKFLKRAKKMAIDHEKFYYLYELLNWEKILLEEAYEEGEFTKDLDGLIEEEKNVIEKLRNLAAYHVLYSKINYVFRSGGYSRNEHDRQVVKEISSHPLIKNKNTALSRRAATICYYIQGFCAKANRDWEKCAEKFNRVNQILDDNPHIKKDLAKRYVNTMDNLIRCHIETKEFDSARKTIDSLRKMSTLKGYDNIDTEVRIFKSSYLSELKLYQRMGDYEAAIKLIDPIMEQLDEYGARINKEKTILFFYHIAYAYFGIGEYNKALFWINKVLNDNETNLRQDIYGYARLFNLIIHFELGNYELLEYIIKSTHRYLSKKGRAYELETLMLSALRRLSKAYTPEMRIKEFERLRPDLIKVLESETEEVALEYFDFKSWVDSHLGELSFADSVKKAG